MWFQGRKVSLVAVSYDKLLHLLIDRQMSNSKRIKEAGFSGNAMAAENTSLLTASKESAGCLAAVWMIL
jgi:hypothetical protein